MTDTIKKSESGSGNWSNATSGNSYTLKAEDDGFYFRATSRAADEAGQSMNSNSAVVGPVTTPLPPLEAGSVTVTGEGLVGYTLSCSEPTVSGGSGSHKIAYFWVDANSKVEPSNKQANTTTVADYDLDKVMYCLVTVTDDSTGETVQVESNRIGPIARPVLPAFDCYVDGSKWDGSSEVGVAISGSVALELRMQSATNPPLDITYAWSIRNGTGQLSGDTSSNSITYVAPDAAPAGATVVGKVESLNAADNADAVAVTILVSE